MNTLSNFGRLVLGCIEADFCVQIRIFQHFSRSTRLAFLRTAPISKIQSKIAANLAKLNIENSMGCLKQALFPSFIKTTGPPTSDFTVDRIISCAGETITFTDLSSSSDVISNWVWDFGDGGSSVIQNPTYQYNQIGNFDVTLIVGEGICTDTLIKNYYIRKKNKGIFLQF